jgi:uncharacterized membrane protein
MDLVVFQHWPLPAIAALVAGIVILLAPRVLNYAVAAYLLFVGAFGLLQAFQGGPVRAEAVLAVVAGVLVLARPAVLSYVVGGYLILVGLLGSGLVRL